MRIFSVLKGPTPESPAANELLFFGVSGFFLNGLFQLDRAALLQFCQFGTILLITDLIRSQ